MADYTLYCLDGSGKIARAPEQIEARSDDEATILARAKGFHATASSGTETGS